MWRGSHKSSASSCLRMVEGFIVFASVMFAPRGFKTPPRLRTLSVCRPGSRTRQSPRLSLEARSNPASIGSRRRLGQGWRTRGSAAERLSLSEATARRPTSLHGDTRGLEPVLHTAKASLQGVDGLCRGPHATNQNATYPALRADHGTSSTHCSGMLQVGHFSFPQLHFTKPTHSRLPL